MARIGTVIRDTYRRPGADALPGHLEDRYGIRVTATARLDAGVFRVDRAEGVLWIRILWLSAWQCWLACVSARVHQGFVPRREYVTALAAKVRAGA